MNFKKIAIALLLAGCASHPMAEPIRQDNAPPLIPTQAESSQSTINAQGFDTWLSAFKTKALQSGISKRTINAALSNLKPNGKVVDLDQKQPEKKLTKEEYLANVISEQRIEKGRELMQENKALLDDISKKTGVEPEYIVALWGLESGYGANTGKFSIVSALATLAYEGRRRDFFESELISALLIIDEGHATMADLKGSWAGAMGQCQFMPSSYLAYAVDYDGDGRIDIWNNKADVFASIANYLSTVGWNKSDDSKEKALMHWNHSNYFVASVFELAGDIK